MKITWFGQSCFLIRDSKGRGLLTDPFDRNIGYKIPNEIVDIVTVSHQHFDHNYTEGLPGTPLIVDSCQLLNLYDIAITGIPSYHDTVFGAKRGGNIIYVFEIDEFRLCHLGDLGHSLSRSQIDNIGQLDILFIPVGGNYTLNGQEASKVAKLIKSHIVVPMHYKTPALTFPLEGVEDFVKYMKNGDKIETSTLEITEKSDNYNIVKIPKFKEYL